MPPRYAYWTILVDGQATAFRAAEVDELLPTLKRLQVKQPTAEMKWFERGRLWPSRDEARDLLRRGYTVAADGTVVPPDDTHGRGKSWRPGGEHRDPREKYQLAKKAKWQKFKQMVRSRPGHGPKAEDAPPPGDDGAPTPPAPAATDWRGRPADPNAPPRPPRPHGPKPEWRDRPSGRRAAPSPSGRTADRVHGARSPSGATGRADRRAAPSRSGRTVDRVHGARSPSGATGRADRRAAPSRSGRTADRVHGARSPSGATGRAGRRAAPSPSGRTADRVPGARSPSGATGRAGRRAAPSPSGRTADRAPGARSPSGATGRAGRRAAPSPSGRIADRAPGARSPSGATGRAGRRAAPSRSGRIADRVRGARSPSGAIARTGVSGPKGAPRKRLGQQARGRTLLAQRQPERPGRSAPEEGLRRRRDRARGALHAEDHVVGHRARLVRRPAGGGLYRHPGNCQDTGRPPRPLGPAVRDTRARSTSSSRSSSSPRTMRCAGTSNIPRTPRWPRRSICRSTTRSSAISRSPATCGR